MGCGVSKEELAKPSRIQTVIVNVGSPESHLKAHEAALKQNNGLVCLVETQYNGPSHDINESDLDNSLSHISTLISSDGLQPLVESPQTEEDVQKEEYYEDLLESTEPEERSYDETPQVQQVVQESSLFQSSNGLVGTLAGLDEILGIQEASSLKLAIKVTAEKIMSYGGVLHSLEDQVGGFSLPLECDGHTLIELEQQVKKGPLEGSELLGLIVENCDKIESATFAKSPKPNLEGFRKKLPPILTPPNSFVFDNKLITDPFTKIPFPVHCQPRIEEIQDLANKLQPPSPQLPHTTEMVPFENIKDIVVMDGASCVCEESQYPSSATLLEGMPCDVDNTILLETLETQEATNKNDSSTIVYENCHNIIVSNLIQDFGENSGVNPFSPLTPFSTCSRRIEYLEEGDIKPLTSDEFYS